MIRQIKAGVLLLVLAQLLWQYPARASGSDAFVALAMIGGGIGVGAAAMGGAGLDDLPEWSYKETGTSARLISGCGLEGEVRLVGNNAYNFVWILLRNNSSRSVMVDYDKIRLNFLNGRNRLAAFPYRFDAVEIKSSNTVPALVPFPSKDDFFGAIGLTIEIPVSECTLQVAMKRNLEVKEVERSSKSTTSFLMTMGFGATATRTGDVSSIGASAFVFDISFYGYPGTHHGFFVGLNADTFGGGNPVTFAPVTGSTTANPALSLLNIPFGYSFRVNLHERVGFSYDIGPTVGIFAYDIVSSREKQSAASLGLFQRLNLNWNITRVRDGVWRGDYSLGATAFHSYLPWGAIGSVSASGHNVGWLITLGLGG